MARVARRVPHDAAEYAEQALGRLFPLAYSLTGSRAAADDLVQDTLLRVLTRWERVQQATQRDAYVRRMMLHQFLSARQRRSAGEVPVGDPATLMSSVGQDGPDVAERLALWQRLGLLNRTQRAVVVLRYYEDLSDADIANALAMSVGNVRVTAHRALAALRSGDVMDPPKISQKSSPKEATIFRAVKS